MNSPRTILFIAFLVVSFFLYQNWMVETAPGTKANETATVTQSSNNTENSDVPSSGSAAADVPEGDQPVVSQQSETTIRVRTDVLDVEIDTRGGDVVSTELLKFAKDLGTEERFQLLQNSSNNVYVAQSGLIGPDGIDASGDGRPSYNYEKESYQSETDVIEVPLTYTTESGAIYRKVFTFTPGKYNVDVRFEVENNTSNALNTQFYGQLKRSMGTGESGSMIMPTYFGAAYSHDDDKFEKYDFDDMLDKKLNVTSQTGWVSMLEHYFVSAWIPEQGQPNRLF
ncbi:MAG: membrane protein insertase YidC, partial [Idiomarina sp.]|nr:membrane protein insertase YidC [Idiomarina sp.]